MVVGGVFLAEGIQKFLFAEALGVGRFIKIGIPAPEIMPPFVGVVGGCPAGAAQNADACYLTGFTKSGRVWRGWLHGAGRAQRKAAA